MFGTEAVITIVARMRDEASEKIQSVGKTVENVDKKSFREFKMTLVAVGSAIVAVGGLLKQIDNPVAQAASNFLLTAGAIMSTVGAIAYAIPAITTMITTLKSLAIVQAIVKALSGPIGWAQIGIGLGIAAAATAGIMAMSGQFSKSSGTREGTAAIYQGSRGGVTNNNTVNVNTMAIMGNEADARKFGRKVNSVTREESRLGR